MNLKVAFVQNRFSNLFLILWVAVWDALLAFPFSKGVACSLNRITVLGHKNKEVYYVGRTSTYFDVRLYKFVYNRISFSIGVVCPLIRITVLAHKKDD